MLDRDDRDQAIVAAPGRPPRLPAGPVETRRLDTTIDGIERPVAHEPHELAPPALEPLGVRCAIFMASRTSLSSRTILVRIYTSRCV
jgi:hypothetical protein